jgi:transcriptional regulator with XRE-family HTH domain
MVLGARLRRLREGRGFSREVAGWQIRASESKISRLELGRVGFKERDVADLLTLYGVLDDTDRAALLTLAREANAPGWWHGYGDVLPPWFLSYIGLEAAASVIRSYEVQFVPGLLQTPEYARAVVLLGHADAPEREIHRRVELRMRRQQVLAAERGPRLWAVVDEAVLRRPIGGPGVLRGQVAALIEATRSRTVRLQMVPFAQGGHAAAGGAFTILRFADEALPDVVYTEQLTGALYLDRRDDVDRYAEAMERVCLQALPPAATVEALRDILDRLPDAD